MPNSTAFLAFHSAWYWITGWAPSGVGSEPMSVSMSTAGPRPVRTVAAFTYARETAVSSRCCSRFSRVRPNVVTARNAESSAAPRA